MLSELILAVLQLGDPSFGWYQSHWEIQTGESGPPLAPDCPDLTGDGIPEVLLNHSIHEAETVVVDGASGTILFQQTELGIHYDDLKYDFLDLDGDLIPELIIRTTSPFEPYGHITIVKGGVVLWDIRGRIRNDFVGTEVLYQDMDGDALPDLIIGSEKNGRIFAFGGATGTLLWSRDGLGRKFHATAPDVNGDGIADFFLGGRGQIICLDGSTGGELWEAPPYLLSDPERWSFNLDDINQDGVSDLILHSHYVNALGVQGSGAYEAHDGVTGALLWSLAGDAYQYLGENFYSEDWTMDGIMDFATHHGNRLVVIDGASGLPFFDQEFLSWGDDRILVQYENFSGGSSTDALVRYYAGWGGSGKIERVDLLKGTILWSTSVERLDRYLPPPLVVDLDSDSTLDILNHYPGGPEERGLLQAINGKDGSTLWTYVGQPWDQIGTLLSMAEIDPIPGADFIATSGRYSGVQHRLALSGATGQILWRHEEGIGGIRANRHIKIDVDGDGTQEIIEKRFSYRDPEYFSTWLAFSTLSGETLWEASPFPNTISWTQFLRTHPDTDGDQMEEVLLVYPTDTDTYKFAFMPANRFGYNHGLHAEPNSISSSSGGSIELEVDFPPDQAFWNYHLLLASTGTGPTLLGNLWVPLSNDKWLAQSRHGIYPFGIVVNPTGILDGNARATIHVQAVPNQIPSSVIGISIFAAVISGVPGFAWHFSSAAESILVLP